MLEYRAGRSGDSIFLGCLVGTATLIPPLLVLLALPALRRLGRRGAGDLWYEGLVSARAMSLRVRNSGVRRLAAPIGRADATRRVLRCVSPPRSLSAGRRGMTRLRQSKSLISFF